MVKASARILFAGGGTGGHVYMAVAVAQQVRTRDPNVPILFAGTADGLEARILPGLGFDLQTIRIGGLKNVGLRQWLKTCLQLPGALVASLTLVGRFAPTLIVGVGGFSSGPLVAAARLRGVPALLIEPNVHPGFANRVLARWSQLAAVAFEETASWFGAKARLTGVPIREAFFQVAELSEPGDRLRVLVFGGSRGSRPINRLLLEALPSLDPERVSIVHQTGPADYAEVASRYAGQPIPAEVREYIEDMPAAFEQADLVISRAGASTIGEITAAGKPAILIPFPQAADDHQTRNAAALASRDAAILLPQAEATGEVLARHLAQLGRQRDRLQSMAQASRHLARPGAAARIVDLMEELASGGIQ